MFKINTKKETLDILIKYYEICFHIYHKIFSLSKVEISIFLRLNYNDRAKWKFQLFSD